MDYEKKYKEALERAKSKLHYPNHPCFVDVTEIFPELKESEDERIRKEIISIVKSYRDSCITEGNHRFDNCIAWLEKQGEQLYWKPSEEQLQTLHAQLNEGAVTYPEDKRILSTLYKDLMKIMTHDEKQDVQKPADKVEPKFHEGDWISGYYTNYKVLSVNNNGYVVEDVDGSKINILFENEKFHHLFTIADAKDGDVLATNSGDICLFDGTVEEGKYPFAYCGLTRYGFDFYDRTLPFTHDYVYPATKEQRDLLFQKMKEARYEWDSEKKKFKKVNK